MNYGGIRRSALRNPQSHYSCCKPVKRSGKIALTGLVGAVALTALGLALKSFMIKSFVITPILLLGPVVGTLVGISIAILVDCMKNDSARQHRSPFNRIN